MSKRAPIVLAATVVGATAVLLYKPMEPAGALASGASSSGAGAASTGSTASGSSSSSSSSSGSSSSTSSSSAKNGTYTGSAVETRFGTAQVKVTIAGGRITAVTAVQLPSNDPRSVSISQGAEPTLQQEVLTKQGASVDVVSGATYTSDGYMASLQSALDQAGYAAPDGSKASTTMPAEEPGGFGH
jgi:uncharacterized protein with FMN-binding domain